MLLLLYFHCLKRNVWHLADLQKYIGKEKTLRELINHPNDGYLYSVDVNDDINYVLAFYLLDIALVSMGIIIYIRNRRIDSTSINHE